jgi:hypothetical protein
MDKNAALRWLIAKAANEQHLANKADAVGTAMALSDRDQHTARAGAFLEVAKHIQEEKDNAK